MAKKKFEEAKKLTENNKSIDDKKNGLKILINLVEQGKYYKEAAKIAFTIAVYLSLISLSNRKNLLYYEGS